jgi:hypothetical protein
MPPGKDGLDRDDPDQDEPGRPLDDIGGMTEGGVEDNNNTQGQNDSLAYPGRPPVQRRVVV